MVLGVGIVLYASYRMGLGGWEKDNRKPTPAAAAKPKPAAADSHAAPAAPAPAADAHAAPAKGHH